MIKSENTKWAKNELGELVEAKKGMDKNHTFTCIGCHEAVGAYAVNTKVQATHFRHTGNTGTSGGCGNYESYIHNFSKEKFMTNYEYSTSFEVRQKIRMKCSQSKYSECTSLVADIINLKERYPHIKLEPRDGSFIPDCLIFNDAGDKIYIEIKFKSPVSQKKIDSGIPIIEIEVHTEKEILELINSGFIDSDNKTIKLINFNNVKPNSVYDCGGKCPQDAVIERNKQLEEKRARLKAEAEAEERVRLQKEERARRSKIEHQAIQKKPTIVGTKTIQLFRPKRCFECETHPWHYMNVGRVVVDDKYNIASIEDDLFKDEITTSREFSVAKREDTGETNAYYCPTCGSWIANNRILGRNTYVHEDEKVLECK